MAKAKATTGASCDEYAEFLAGKQRSIEPVGFEPDESVLCSALFPFQRDIAEWALRRGRAAIFSDCGTGKSVMELAWADQVARKTGQPVLILTPLAVAQQFTTEGRKFSIPVTQPREPHQVTSGVNVTNYERLHKFNPADFGGIVLDESSILKNFSGATRKEVTEFGSTIRYRLSATATPAPNDLVELTNQAEFLEIMTGKEIIALFFTQDGNTTHSWRLKGHARQDFWRWLATWSVALRRPSDLGYSDDGYVLPPLTIHQRIVESPPSDGMLFVVEAITLDEQRAARRASMPFRVTEAAAMVNGSDEPWVIWCDLNAESEALRRAIPGSVEVRGSDDPEKKERALVDFAEGRLRVLITKPSIAGFGVNWQHCSKMAFVGLSHSYEQFYQAIRRCWRFGQERPVEVWAITSEAEGAVVQNIQRKERQAEEMMDELVSHMAGLQMAKATRDEMAYEECIVEGDGWKLMLGDTVERMLEIADESVDLTITSPPFPGMYAYTNSSHDIGNTETIDQMIEHFRYVVDRKHLYRITAPGRMACIHLMQLTAMLSRDGHIGVKDYRGRVIQMFEEEGWVYAGEVTIEKNPQIQATRNKERGLLFKTLATDSSLMRMALADYLIYFRKPGKNARPIHAGISDKYNRGHGWITEEEWIEWASPVWYRQRAGFPGGIRETDVLNVSAARESEDERHLCPMQLGVIERAVKLWSAPGDLVFDPFNGIGSTGTVALQHGRRYIGTELKRSYFEQAARNLMASVKQGSLFAPGLVEAIK